MKKKQSEFKNMSVDDLAVIMNRNFERSREEMTDHKREILAAFEIKTEEIREAFKDAHGEAMGRIKVLERKMRHK
jgi:hypothetical protein